MESELEFEFTEDELRERQRRRKLKKEWYAEARSIRDAAPNKRMLLREAKQVALTRIEDAARTQAQFEDLNRMWDDREIVEKWRIAKHEHLILGAMKHYELPDSGRVIPVPFAHVWWRQLLSGDFIGFIHDCPHELHEQTTSRPVFDFISELDEDQMEILYYRAIRQWTPQQIAALRGQTDRNIRKVYANMIADIRKKMYFRLRPRYVAKLPLTFAQKEFCKNYLETLDDVEKAKIKRIIEDEERMRSRKRRR